MNRFDFARVSMRQIRWSALAVGVASLLTCVTWLSHGVVSPWRMAFLGVSSVVVAWVAEAMVSPGWHAAATPQLRDVEAVTSHQPLKPFAHLMRTALNSILGFSDVLLSGIDGPLTTSQRNDIEAIRGAGHRVRSIVENSVAFPSRILDESRVQQATEPMRAVLQSVVLELQVLRPDLDPAVLEWTSARDEVRANVDRELIHRALVTLADGVRMQVSAPRLVITARDASPSALVVEVALRGAPALPPLRPDEWLDERHEQQANDPWKMWAFGVSIRSIQRFGGSVTECVPGALFVSFEVVSAVNGAHG